MPRFALQATTLCISLLVGCASSPPPPGRPTESSKPTPPAPLAEFCTTCPTFAAQREKLLATCARTTGSQFEGTCGSFRVLKNMGYPVEETHYFDATGALVAYVESGSEHGPWRRVFGVVPEQCALPRTKVCPQPSP